MIHRLVIRAGSRRLLKDFFLANLWHCLVFLKRRREGACPTLVLRQILSPHDSIGGHGGQHMVIYSQLTGLKNSLITGQTGKGQQKHDPANNTWPPQRSVSVYSCLSLLFCLSVSFKEPHVHWWRRRKSETWLSPVLCGAAFSMVLFIRVLFSPWNQKVLTAYYYYYYYPSDNFLHF